MSTEPAFESRTRRAVNDFIVAEMLLVGAAVESANAIGDGLGELARTVTEGDEHGASPWDSIRSVLARTADEAIEPWSSRLRLWRDTAATQDEE